MIFGSAEQINLTEDTRKAEAVLVLKIGAVTPLDNKHVKAVFTCGYVIGNIKFARAAADLAVADKLLVYEKIEAGGNTLKIYVNSFAEISADGKRAAVMAAGIFLGHVRRVKRKRITQV